MAYGWAPSATRSSTPVTVTGCGAFQLSDVNVRLAGATVPSAVRLDERARVTFAVGCEFNTTVKESVPPASVVVSPEVGATVMPAESLSTLVAETSAAFKPL